MKICPEHYNEDLKLFPRPNSEKKEKLVLDTSHLLIKKSTRLQSTVSDTAIKKITKEIQTEKKKEKIAKPDGFLQDQIVVFNRLQMPRYFLFYF